MQSKLKPFDLEAALNGAEVVTREGKEVTEIVQLKTMTFTNNNLLAVIGGNLYAFNQDGKIHEDLKCNRDLFMKPTQVTKWLNIYEYDNRYTPGGTFFDTKEQALESSCGSTSLVDTIQITFEV